MKTTFLRYFGICFFVLFGVLPHTSEAAALYIDPPTTELNRGDSVTLSVRLDTDEAAHECVNAVDGVLTYTSNIEPVDVSIGDSIFNIWVEQPVINRDARTITFAGGIPNGYCGRVSGDPRLTNTLAKIVFRSPGFQIGGSQDTTAEVAFAAETTAYLNDGYGTAAKLATYPAKMQLSQKPGTSLINPWQDEVNADTIAPEEFSISLQRDERAFSQKYYIVFNTSDKQTGIDHYEVIEEPLTQFGSFQWGRADAPWRETRSPFVLKDQSLNSIIRVKAVDKAGNEYIATLIPDESVRTISQTEMMLVGGGLLLVLVLLMVVLGIFQFLRKRRRKKVAAATVATPLPDTDNELYEINDSE